MPVTHVNRKEDRYYLHSGTTKTGKPRYWFAKNDEGDLATSIPEGYEVYENPEAQVFLRKIVPQLVTEAEVAVVKHGIERYASGQNCIVDVQKGHIVVYHAEKERLDRLEGFGFGLRSLPVFYGPFMKVMRFTLADKTDRTFRVQRWCYRGSIDDWIDLWSSGGSGELSKLVQKYCPHIGQESFFELM